MIDDLELFKACADETRLRLLVLVAQRELCVCELVEILRMPQGKISRHLAVLRRAGLVDDRREGTWIHYSLRRPETPLGRRLRAYLTGEARQRPECAADLARYEALSCCDESCGQEATPTRRGAARTAGATA